MEVEKRQRSVRNMWIIVWTVFVTETYSTLYSIVLAIWADENCYVQETVWVKSLSTFIERSLQYVWWMYPLMWLLWPEGFRLSCCHRKKKSRSVVDRNLYQSSRSTDDCMTESVLSTSVNESQAHSLRISNDIDTYIDENGVK